MKLDPKLTFHFLELFYYSTPILCTHIGYGNYPVLHKDRSSGQEGNTFLKKTPQKKHIHDLIVLNCLTRICNQEILFTV